ncbi:MAG: cyclodeaminase/cyclohydrolase family protein, partial [Candidatus Sabulitectum sp.]|nr:cyclodeaminase/cyclohydrolase family protein [Candidatus Sabulitectum sp.]
ARACATGAYYNVLINLPEIEDQNYKKRITEEADALLAETEKLAAIVQEKLIAKLKNEG